ISSAAAVASLSRRRLAIARLRPSQAPPTGTPSAVDSDRPPAWTVVSSPGSRTSNKSALEDEPNALSRPQQRRLGPAEVPHPRARSPDQVPAAGRREGIDAGLVSGDADAPRRHARSGRGQPWRRDLVRDETQVAKA